MPPPLVSAIAAVFPDRIMKKKYYIIAGDSDRRNIWRSVGYCTRPRTRGTENMISETTRNRRVTPSRRGRGGNWTAGPDQWRCRHVALGRQRPGNGPVAGPPPPRWPDRSSPDEATQPVPLPNTVVHQ